MDLNELQARYKDFIEERGWTEFHTPKNVAMSITIEAAELLEIFQWSNQDSASEIRENHGTVEAIEDELAYIIIYCMSMAIQLDIDLLDAVENKLDKNQERFDMETSDKLANDLQNFPEQPNNNTNEF